MSQADLQSRLTADREKRRVALLSLWAAVGLTGFKTVIGLLTGSLGILAEAAHSALDLVAALMTFLAVRVSSKPADREHLYGHGKIENLSALFETMLLLVTCGWIIYEAGHRLLAHSADEVEVNAWSFGVMLTSIAVDFSRSRALRRAAIKHNSQALEADALHFETDIWSSAAVIIGLTCVAVGKAWPAAWFLKYGDVISALVVAGIVVFVSIELGRRTVNSLLDTVPVGLDERIRRVVEAIPGAIDCHRIRIRYSGAQAFIDVHITVDGSQTLSAAHTLTELVETAIQEKFPGADVTVHPEPKP